jgi:shikimate dehydrogenase
MHDAAFAHFGIDARYELTELAPEDLDAFFEGARSPEWMGFQVTAPYKQEALRRCDVVDDLARTIGAVNSVRRSEGGALVGFNTDVGGFVRSVTEDLGRDMRDAAVVVAGAGGAARAVVHGCLGAGAARVVVGARNPEAASALAASTGDARVVGTGLDSVFGAELGRADLAVNATTVGMTSAGMAFDPAVMADGAAVFDLVYVPAETPLIVQARSRGLDVTNGLGMLIAQAEEAFTAWTGVPDAGAVMRAALEASSLASDA